MLNEFPCVESVSKEDRVHSLADTGERRFDEMVRKAGAIFGTGDLYALFCRFTTFDEFILPDIAG